MKPIKSRAFLLQTLCWLISIKQFQPESPPSISLLCTSVCIHVSVCAHHTAYVCWPPAAVLSPHQYSEWKGVVVGSWALLSIKCKKNRHQASGSVLSLNWSSLLSRICTMCAYVLQYKSPVRPLIPLNWVFQSPNELCQCRLAWAKLG